MCGFMVISGKIEKDVFKQEFDKIKYRGPDHSNITKLPKSGTLGFHRLSIMDLSDAGNQPFISSSKNYLVCNGEIYNYKSLKSDFVKKYEFKSDSDCEVILPLYQKYGVKKLVANLEAEYAFVIYDSIKDEFIAARDEMGIRPLFYGHSKVDSKIAFASEAKCLISICDEVKPFPPGHIYKGGKFVKFNSYSDVPSIVTSIEDVYQNINSLLTKAVEKRLQSDAPVGLLLSGGLDSSLVCAIAAKVSKRQIKTFSVGINENPIDTKYAKIVADYLGTDHTEILFTKEDALSCLTDLIYKLETFDITTVRASIGMHFVCKYIRENTDIKVVLTGEVSDELFGYKYTDFAPSEKEFQKEAEKRIEELYIYDVLRADRCISSNSLEARVPFSDKDFVKYVMSIPPKMKMNTTGVGKYILRKAFEKGDYLPEDILYREKAAFSDAVGHSMVDHLKDLAEKTYTQVDLLKAAEKYTHSTPFTKESLLYREIFEGHFKGHSSLIKDFWMPNKSWKNCDVVDPSARVLPNYGKSGS